MIGVVGPFGVLTAGLTAVLIAVLVAGPLVVVTGRTSALQIRTGGLDQPVQ